ncbi:hypothetical protein [Lentzea californiensis]|uniref:hypothetical protein n=1 Tax=Lentzea californiensis TaxID=438851 RepID=UPI0021660B55|nr:hypothetical protein [Lentzea californiensis]MCR3752262.1 hypothetical protein [Lentzea californiensis]
MTGAPTQAELDAARLVLDRMGVTAEDLLNSVKPLAPTFGEYIPVVAAAVSDGTRRAYTPYWNRVLDQWADISLSDRTPTDIQRLVQRIKANLTVRRNTRNGNSAAEQLIAALRCLYRHAVNDELIDERSNPVGCQNWAWRSDLRIRPPRVRTRWSSTSRDGRHSGSLSTSA